MVDITIVNGVKPTYNWGAPPCGLWLFHIFFNNNHPTAPLDDDDFPWKNLHLVRGVPQGHPIPFIVGYILINFVCTNIYIYACMYVCMHVCIYVYIYIYTHVHVVLSMVSYMYVYIYTHIYQYNNNHEQLLTINHISMEYSWYSALTMKTINHTLVCINLTIMDCHYTINPLADKH